MPCKGETGFKIDKAIYRYGSLETKTLIPPCLLRPLKLYFLRQGLNVQSSFSSNHLGFQLKYFNQEDEEYSCKKKMKCFSYQILKLYSYFCITYASNKIPAVCDVSILFKCSVKTLSEMQGNSVVSIPYILHNSPWRGSNLVYFLHPQRALS